MPSAAPPAAAPDTGRVVLDRATAVAFAAGSHEAVEKVFAQCSARIRDYIWLMVGERESAEEIVQETFLAAYSRRAALQAPEKLVSWLFAIARNLGLKELRRRRRRPEFLLGEDGLDLLEEAPDPAAPDVASLLANRQLRVVLKEALDALNPKERELVATRYFAHLPLNEIAEAMEMPMGSVGTTIQRALAKMKKHFERRGFSPEDFLR